MKTDASQSGAILLYILIAIGLIAGLTAVMSRGNRVSESTLTDQQAKVAAQEIIEYGNAVANAVAKLRLRGFNENQIGFGNEVYQTQNGTLLNAPGHNPNCTTDACEIFNPNGGGMNPFITSAVVPNPSASAYTPGHFAFNNKNFIGVGNDTLYDLYMSTTNIQREVCLAINELSGIENPDGEPPGFSDLGGSIYNGSYTDDGNSIDAPEIRGATNFCHERTSTPGRYMYFRLLLAR